MRIMRMVFLFIALSLLPATGAAQPPVVISSRVGWDAKKEETSFKLYEIVGRMNVAPFFKMARDGPWAWG